MSQRILLPLLLSVAALAGCDLATRPAAAPKPPPQQTTAATILAPQGAKTAAAFDRTTEAEKAAVLSAPAGGAEIGKTSVSLGNPAEQGFWLKTALVKEKRAGVVKLASGKTAQVDLLPASGGGAQLSLAAYRALGLGLTDLPNVTVLSR